MRIVVRRGLSVQLEGIPDQQMIDDDVQTERAGLLGHDLGLIRAEVLVEAGQKVRVGTPLLRDRKRPELVFVSPLSGAVERIEMGPRRRLSEIIVTASGTEEKETFDVSGSGEREGLRAVLLAAGQWPAIRSRPFERIADPDATPIAIFVTAIDTTPHAPDPIPIVKTRLDDFARGLDAMALLADCPVYLCQPDVAPLIEESERCKAIRFVGRHPAGLVGTHIARLCAPGDGEAVWHIGCQDVIAIGHLLRTGTIDPLRIMSLSGPGLRKPRLVRVPLGVDVHALVRSDLTPGPKTILSGSVLWGAESTFLGRYHLQSCVLDRKSESQSHWLIEALRKAQMPPPFIPTQALENALGPETPIVPLLRALSIGDAEAAVRLGCLHLAEEDLALASYVTGRQTDFGLHLRAVLDNLEADA